MRSALAVLVLSVLGACSNAPSEKQCEQLLENVINITKVEDKIQRLLGTMKVHVDQGQIGGVD